ncbi:MAG: glycosyltransferase family 4 protein [Gracilimonas sp.]
MKITYISDQFLPTSSADTEQFVNMISALSKQSKIELISANYKFRKATTLQDLKDYYLIDGDFKLDFVHLLFPNIRGLEKILIAIKSAFKIKDDDHKDEVVYTRNIPVIISTLLFTNLPVLYETFRPWPQRNIQARWFFRKMANHPRFLGIVLHSEFAKKSFLENGFSEKQLIVEHNAFRNEFFSDIEFNKSELRKTLKLPAEQILVTYTGRVNRQKGLDYMLELARSFPEVTFLIVGSEGHGYIEVKAKTITNVVIKPWQDKASTARYILASDILYIPTSLVAREKAMNTVLPIKTFLYKASGKAILAPDIADIREVLTHKKTAFLVEPDNKVAAEVALRELLNNARLRDELGEAAKDEMEFLTWEKRAKRVLAFIEKRKLRVGKF